MKTRTLLCILFGSLVTLGGSRLAHASLINNVVSGVINSFQDNSVSFITNSTGTIQPFGTLPVAGDLLAGIVWINSNNELPGGLNGSLAVVFAFQFTSVTGGPGNQFTLGNAPAGTLVGQTFTTTGGSTFKLLGGSQFSSLTGSSDSVAIITNPNVTPNGSKLYQLSVTSAFSTINSNPATTGYGLDAGGLITASDFLQSTLNPLAINTPGAQLGTENGILHATPVPAESNLVLLPAIATSNVFTLPGENPIYTQGTFNPATLYNDNIAFTSNLVAAGSADETNGWDITDTSTFSVDPLVLPVPEPASVVIWSLVLAVGLGVARVRGRLA